jgi:hypothetical protein
LASGSLLLSLPSFPLSFLLIFSLSFFSLISSLLFVFSLSLSLSLSLFFLSLSFSFALS